MSGNISKKIAFNYFGSKLTHVDNLEVNFPDHYHFVDLFCGSLAVTLNKKKSNIETVNDINSEVITFFRVLRDNPEELVTNLVFTPYSREEFESSWNTEGNSDLEIARKFYVRVRQSFMGLGSQRENKGWALAVNLSRAGIAETCSKFNNGIKKLLPLVGRIKELQIENKDFREIIKLIDYEEAFFYCDPPYPREVRGSYNDYRYEFSKADNEDLAELLNNAKGKVMISGYDGKFMEKNYPEKKWTKVCFPIKQNNIRKNNNKQECVWMNYPPPAVQNKLNL